LGGTGGAGGATDGGGDWGFAFSGSLAVTVTGTVVVGVGTFDFAAGAGVVAGCSARASLVEQNTLAAMRIGQSALANELEANGCGPEDADTEVILRLAVFRPQEQRSSASTK